MLFSCLILALSVSIDSFGIGITYGLKNTKISCFSKIILFFISIVITSLSLILGDVISYILSDNFSKILGCILLIFMGFRIIFQSTDSYDKDNSNSIDWKEALYLGIALSIDSICVGISSSMLGFNTILFPIFVATFQLIFLSIGKEFGLKLSYASSIPDSIWNIISGILLICIGIGRFFS